MQELMRYRQADYVNLSRHLTERLSSLHYNLQVTGTLWVVVDVYIDVQFPCTGDTDFLL